MDKLKDIAMCLAIWIIVSVVTTIFWNEFVGAMMITTGQNHETQRP
jgi:uncharacterized membrane protein